MLPKLFYHISVGIAKIIYSAYSLNAPTTTVLMNGLSSSCVLASTTVPQATSADVRRMVTGGLIRLVLLLTGVACLRIPATSTPRVTIGVATALLCAAEQLVTALRVQSTNNRCKIYDSEVN